MNTTPHIAQENNNKTVSVVMCTYNGETHLREQLDTILAQTYPIHELIIQDDGSTDNTLSIIQEYATLYPSIQIHQHNHIYPTDGSYTHRLANINDNFFSAMSKAKGDIIAIADQDDIWHPEKIATQVKALENHALCYHLTAHFNTQPDYSFQDQRIPNLTPQRALFGGANPYGHTIALRRTFLQDILNALPKNYPYYITATLGSVYDSILVTIASTYHHAIYLPKAYTFHRLENNYSQTNSEGLRKSQRSLKNAITQILRNCNPKRRHQKKPIIQQRMQDYLTFLQNLPTQTEGKLRDIAEIEQLINAYLQIGTWQHPIQHIRYRLRFQHIILQQRHHIFYTQEPNEAVAILRALLFPYINIYEYFPIY